MNKNPTSRTSKRTVASKTDWLRIRAMRDADIDLSDIPEVNAEMAALGVVRVAGKARSAPLTGSEPSPGPNNKRR